MADVFFSYASEDRDRIRPIVSALEQSGLSIWWDRQLIAGPDFTHAIQAALEECRCVVVAWSTHSIHSSWVRDEAQEGMDRNCLVPIVLDDVRPPLGFRSLHAVALSQDAPPSEFDRLVEGIRHRLGTLATGAPGSAISEMTRPLANSPIKHSEKSLVVLPFTNLSSDREQQFFCDGLVEDITTELSYIKLLLVISRNSSFSYRDDVTDIAKVVRELSVDYVLTGSVRRSGERMRVSVRLIEGRTERTLWSNRYDRDVTDLFDLQDELTQEIVTALDIQIATGTTAIRVRQFRNVQTREVLYRGMYEFRKFEQSANVAARRYFLAFIDQEPNSVEGYSWMLLTYSFAIVVGWDAPQEAMPKLAEWASRAQTIDPDDGQALAGFGIFNVLAGDLDQARQSLNRAIEVDPNLDDAWLYRGWCLMLLGESTAAVESLKQALRLSPVPNSVRFGVLGTAQRNAGQFEDSIATFKECLRVYPDFIYAHTSLAIVYAMMGRQAEAKEEIARTLEMDSTYTVQRFITPDLYRDPAFMQRNAEMLRLAGLPES